MFKIPALCWSCYYLYLDKVCRQLKQRNLTEYIPTLNIQRVLFNRKNYKLKIRFFHKSPNYSYFHSTNFMHIFRNGLLRRRQNKTRSACSILTTGFRTGGCLRIAVALAAATCNALFHPVPLLILISIYNERRSLYKI